MKKALCVLILAAALPVTAWSACNYPRAPGKAPDGTSATRDQMVAGKKLVDEYQKLMNEYLACLKSEHQEVMNGPGKDSMMAEQRKETEDRYTAKNDAAVDEMQQVADRFNEQLRVYKAKNAK
jgi:hypothetical protein